MRVFLQSGAAAGRVGDDGVEIIREERIDILVREIACGVAYSCVCCQRAAASLRGGDDYFAAVGLQDADGGAIQFAERDLGDASGEECDAGPAGALCWERLAQLSEEKIGVDARQELFAVLQAEQTEDAGGAGYGCESGALIDFYRARGCRDSAGVGKQAAIDEVAGDARGERTFIFLFDLRAGELESFSVFDAGGADGFAVATIQAAVNVQDERFAEFEAALIHQGHLLNASARRIGFAP